MYRIFIVLTFFFLAAALFPADVISAPVSVRSKPFRIEVREGRISTDVNDIPVSMVLEEIRRQSNLQYRVPPELTRFGISVTLKDVPLDQGLAVILAPFNYAITQTDSTPHHPFVELLGLKGSTGQIPGAVQPTPIDNGQAASANDRPQVTETPPESADLPRAVIPAQAPEVLPVTPMARPSMPVQNQVPAQILPASRPVSNATGPLAPNTGQYRELPPFTPITNQTGPVLQR